MSDEKKDKREVVDDDHIAVTVTGLLWQSRARHNDVTVTMHAVRVHDGHDARCECAWERTK